MNELELQQQIDSVQTPMEHPNLFTKPESISRHIFEVDQSPANAFNKDTARANLEWVELNSVKTNIGLIASIVYAEKFMQDVAETQEEVMNIQSQMLRLTNFFRDEQSGTTVPTRSKRGFAIYMAKTERSIQMQDMSNYGVQQQQEFSPGEPKSLKDKLSGALPFLKKKEM